MLDEAAVLVTCEHGGKRIPRRYAELFAGSEELLASHRGWDPGAERLARALAGALGTVPIVARISRLLVDLNRSPGHPRQFSEFTGRLPGSRKLEIVRRYYFPYRRRVVRRLCEMTSAGRLVAHFSVHSFTPRWKGKPREVDVGILFDPARVREKELGDRIRNALQELRPDWRIRFNRPYRGTSDGLTTWLRRNFPADKYLGLELEFSQALLARRLRGPETGRVTAVLAAAVKNFVHRR